MTNAAPTVTTNGPLPGPKVGIFSADELAKLVERTVPKERDGKPLKGAIVGTVDADGAAIVVEMRKGEHWTVKGAVKREWAGDTKAGAQVVWSW